MSFSDLVDAVKALPTTDKMLLMQELAGNLTPEETLLAESFPPGAVFEIYTPYDCHEAAAALQKMLDEEKGQG